MQETRRSAAEAGAPLFAIEAEGLVRRFGSVLAVAGLDLRVRKGEFFSLLGPSGCGKTTLLRIIAGLESTDGGSLQIGGRPALAIPAHQRPVNTVFQSYALFPHMSVRDNVAFGLRMKRVPEAEVARRVSRVLEMVEASTLISRRPSQLSGGQKQRVALARAIVNEPDVLLLDEPLGALDLRLRKQLQSELHLLQRRLGITFLYVTHDQDEALGLSDRVAVMNQGRIEQMGEPAAIYERPRTRFVAQFLGSCNLLAGRVLECGAGEVLLETTVGNLRSFPADLRDAPPAAGAHVNLSLRPEKILVGQDLAATDANRIEATIEDVLYNGPETRYRLRAREWRFEAVTLNALARNQLAGGASVPCTFAPESLVILED